MLDMYSGTSIQGTPLGSGQVSPEWRCSLNRGLVGAGNNNILTNSKKKPFFFKFGLESTAIIISMVSRLYFFIDVQLSKLLSLVTGVHFIL